MLAPTINQAETRLTNAYQSIASLDQFATTSSDIVVVKLPHDPGWLPEVRAEFEALRALAAKWRDGRSNVWAPILVGFTDYITTFNAFASTAKHNNLDKDQWISQLETVLLPAVTEQTRVAKRAVTDLESHRMAFSSVLPRINKSIQAGWVALGDEEQDMLKLAEEIGGLHQLVTSYGAKLNSDIITGDKSYIQSIVSLTYAAVAAGASASIPILGIATAVFSIGKSFYDIIEDNEHIIQTMKRIEKLQQELSDDAVNLSLTKGTLQILYQLEMSYLQSKDALPEIVDLWEAEQNKVQDAVNALKAGAHPDQYLDLLTLSIARTNWTEISGFVRDLADSDIQMGVPVILDIARGTIKPGSPDAG